MVYFRRCIFKTNQKWPFHPKQNNTVLASKQQYCICYRLEAYVGYSFGETSVIFVRQQVGDYLRRLSAGSSELPSFQSILPQRSGSLSDYRLFQANYGTVYASRSYGSKAFTVVLVFVPEGVQISVQRTTA